MRICSFDELSKKEVISCMDCTRLGFIIDLNIQLENAQIVSVVVEIPGNFLCLFKRRTITIPWECIKKIGDDLIIADYIKPNDFDKSEHKGVLFRFFKN